MSFLRMDELDLTGKRVMIREDFNVPLDAGRVTSDARIQAALPTIRMALDGGAAVILMSHLGRPTEGQYEEKFSLAPVAEHLSGLLGVADPIKASTPEALQSLHREGVEVVMLTGDNRTTAATPDVPVNSNGSTDSDGRAAPARMGNSAYRNQTVPEHDLE